MFNWIAWCWRKCMRASDAVSRESAALAHHVNPRLSQLQPYPFEKLRILLAGVTPNPDVKAVNLSIGEPKHPTPEIVKAALVANLDGLAAYPATVGLPELRE